MNIDGYRKSVQDDLHRLQQIIANASDILENRIVQNLKDISRAVLVDMPTVGALSYHSSPLKARYLSF